MNTNPQRITDMFWAVSLKRGKTFVFNVYRMPYKYNTCMCYLVVFSILQFAKDCHEFCFGVDFPLRTQSPLI